MRQAFGACANEFAPDDGKVVAVDHGCGAHSEAIVVPVSPAPPPPLIDEAGYDIVERPAAVEESPQPEADVEESPLPEADVEESPQPDADAKAAEEPEAAISSDDA